MGGSQIRSKSRRNTRRGKAMKNVWTKRKCNDDKMEELTRRPHLKDHDYLNIITDNEYNTATRGQTTVENEPRTGGIVTKKNVIRNINNNVIYARNDHDCYCMKNQNGHQVTLDTPNSDESDKENRFDTSALELGDNDGMNQINSSTPEQILEPSVEQSDLEFSFISKEEYDSILQHELCIERVAPEKDIDLQGHRIVDLQYVLNWAMTLQVDHMKKCTTGKMQLVKEERVGLVSNLTFKCNMCDEEITKSTENPKHKQSILNYGAVWGTVASGSTYTQMKERLSVLDIPSMSYRRFHQIELELGDHWKSYMWSSIEEAGQEEYALARGKNQLDESGNVWTKVYVDGGWSHRSYGHNYNAASGVAVIIGELTAKVLFLGIRNKYCSVCARAINRQQQPNSHKCFKNWNESSGAMEADIIVEGFRQSQVMHNLKYLKFVGDGDSSVFAKIKEHVSYGDEVEKIECKNHAIKNYGSGLYKIKNDTKINIAGRKFLTSRNIKNLQNIVLRQLEINANGNVEKLKKDWANGPNHVFGNHLNCSSEYCNTPGNIQSNMMLELESSGIHYHIYGVLDRLIGKAHKLINNETNNCAELFMSFLTKFNAGKHLNLTQRGSFETRAYISGIKYNEGVTWHTDTWKELIEESPGKNFKKFLSDAQRNQENRVKRRLFVNTNEKKPKKKKVAKSNVSQGYGPNALQAPLNKEELESEKNRFLRTMQLTSLEIQNLERRTVGQWSNPLYVQVRKHRLTASNFGPVIKRRKTTKVDNFIKVILGLRSVRSEAVEYGIIKEGVARQKFAALRSQTTIQECGIFIHENYGYLAASPDGIVGTNGIMEIKCLYKVHKSGKSLEEFIKTDKNTCVEMRDGRIQLKKNHNYYYQIQGQLNISKKQLCFFIIYINDQEPLYIDAILRDEKFWETQMLPKLVDFYENHLLTAITTRNLAKLNKNTFSS